MAHLTHKLPWSSLSAAIKRDPDWRMRHKEERETYDKKVAQFVGALSNAIEEFGSTDKRSDEEKAEYDVFQWDTAFDQSYAVYGINSLVGRVGRVVNAYVVLNLLVEDEARMRPVLSRTWILREPAGFADGGHPEKFADMLLPLLDNSHVTDYGRFSKYEPKKLTPGVVDGIRRYCAELFKVMYTRPDVFTRDRIEGDLIWILDHLYKEVGEQRAV